MLVPWLALAAIVNHHFNVNKQLSAYLSRF